MNRLHERPQFFSLPDEADLCHATLQQFPLKCCISGPGLNHTTFFGQEHVSWHDVTRKSIFIEIIV